MILTLGDERLLALVLADILLLPLVVPLGASTLLLVGVPTLVLVAVLAVLLVPGAVIIIPGTLLLGALGGKWLVLPQLKQVFARACLLLKVRWNLWMISASSSFPSTSNCSSVTDTREDKQKPPREGLELAPELPTRAIDLEAEASA